MQKNRDRICQNRTASKHGFLRGTSVAVAYISEEHARKLADFSELPTENTAQIRDSKKSVSAQ